jgi:hypothetical protein
MKQENGSRQICRPQASVFDVGMDFSCFPGRMLVWEYGQGFLLQFPHESFIVTVSSALTAADPMSTRVFSYFASSAI